MKKIIACIICYVLGISIVFIPKVYSKYRAYASSNLNLNVAKWVIGVNGSSTNSSINLNNTITNTSYATSLVPGSTGLVQIQLDFTNVEVVTDYTVTFTRENLPNNLRFYSDSGYQNEIQTINGSYTPGNTATSTTDLYWKWIYSETEESNTNDSLFMDSNISLGVTINANQRVGGGA